MLQNLGHQNVAVSLCLSWKAHSYVPDRLCQRHEYLERMHLEATISH